MAKKERVSETPATALLRQHRVPFTEHPYEYLEHGGAQHSAGVLGLDPFTVVKTLIMQDQDAKPLVVLMHGNRKVSTKNLARLIGAKSVEPCTPRWPTATAATWWAALRRLAPVVRCLSTLKRPSLLCLASSSMAGAEGIWWASIRRSVCSCWGPGRCSARSTGADAL
jgi:hypothetical protein